MQPNALGGANATVDALFNGQDTGCCQRDKGLLGVVGYNTRRVLLHRQSRPGRVGRCPPGTAPPPAIGAAGRSALTGRPAVGAPVSD